MTNHPSDSREPVVRPPVKNYTRVGSLYVAATLYVMSWGTVVPLVARTPLRLDRPAVWLCCGVVLAALLGLTWLITRAAVPGHVETRPFRRAVAWYLGVVAVGAVIVAVVGQAAYAQLAWLGTLPLICGAFAASMVSTRWGAAATIVLVPACLPITGTPGALWIFLVLGAANFFYVRLAMWIFRHVRELDAARRQIARMSIDQERSRFSRDLHDVMGRSLSSIALTCELALSVRDDAAAKDTHVRDAQRTAQRALADMRALVRGYHDIEFETELADALVLLRTAGVLAEADGDGGAELDPEASEAAAWVVRESVTNVLKHAPAATECELTMRDGVLEIVNDGVDERSAGDGLGRGLAGLRERVEAVGGTFAAGRDGAHFRVRCELPLARQARGPQRDRVREVDGARR
ncbi:sensor histidine kinase [Rhodococcoides corynebacterioides]|uniref:sensor histidine kinase n=1 Tax=Rhodococcoides corynebacterioides TaxID=53972 RepID=UPI0009FA48A4|nr:histidine kinase [Rhodococcus corynebacterioides]MBY6351859.1 hypothetical protein [Rhodococcus corynebacterioides]